MTDEQYKEISKKFDKFPKPKSQRPYLVANELMAKQLKKLFKRYK